MPKKPNKDRARDYGLPFIGTTGHSNAITDVTGVSIGHRTVIKDQASSAIRTGVTAVTIDPKDTNSGVPAAIFSFNGTGEFTGSHLIEEIGAVFGPILLTGTLNVGSVRDGALQWARDNIAIQSDRFTRILPVVAETFDGRLHDAWNYAFDPQLAAEAITAAKGGFVAEGAVGGGTGMISFGFKGGIGTSSRLVAFGEKQYTVGALAQCNFGFREALTILGAPVGRAIGDLQPVGVELDDAAHSSLIVVIATDAPFDAISLKRIARRAVLGMGRLGGAGEATSGDIFLAFSTAARIKLDGIQPNVISSVPPASFDPFAIASVDAVEEAIINALFAGTTMDGNDGSRVYALPPERAATIIRQWHA